MASEPAHHAPNYTGVQYRIAAAVTDGPLQHITPSPSAYITKIYYGPILGQTAKVLFISVNAKRIEQAFDSRVDSPSTGCKNAVLYSKDAGSRLISWTSTEA